MRTVAERTVIEKERIEEGLITVREVLGYLDQDRYLNRAQASEYLGISKRNIRARARLKTIPHYRVGGKLLFKKSELDEWMSEFREDGNEELDELVNETVADVLGD